MVLPLLEETDSARFNRPLICLAPEDLLASCSGNDETFLRSMGDEPSEGRTRIREKRFAAAPDSLVEAVMAAGTAPGSCPTAASRQALMADEEREGVDTATVVVEVAATTAG